MPAKDPLVYVMHMRDSCQRITEYTAAGGSDWPSKKLVVDAICQNISIIGEAARHLDERFRKMHPEIPWSSIIGARNIVMHAYEYLKPELIQEMAENDVPVLLANCLRMLNEECTGH